MSREFFVGLLFLSDRRGFGQSVLHQYKNVQIVLDREFGFSIIERICWFLNKFWNPQTPSKKESINIED